MMPAIFLSLASQALAASAPTRISLPENLRTSVAEIRWTPALTQQLIREMPKVETHLHLDGSLSPKTIKELAVAQGYAPLATKSLREIAKVAVADKPKDSLAEVLKAFPIINPILHTPEAVERMAYEVIAAASRQNIRYVEVRFAPTLHATETFSSEQVLEAALRGLERGEKEFGIKSGVIVCLIRPFQFVSKEKNEEMTELAIKYAGKGVVGLDLAGNEAAAPLSDFKELFLKAKAAGLKLTAHAGEVPGSQDLETALEIGVDRLGHATLLAQKPDLLERVKALGIPIEVNLTSNLRTAAVKDLKDHPVKTWYAAGIPVTVSTDDPGVFGIDLNHEYGLLESKLKFSAEDLVNVAFQGVDALFLPEAKKAELKSAFETELKGILGRLGKGGRPAAGR